jgi:hypothetical protein
MKPGVEETPWFRRNYLHEWVIEDDSLVYRYQPGRNDFDAIPDAGGAEWHHVLAIDLGYNDASAFVLIAYNDYDQSLYVLEVYKRTKMDVTDVANKAKQYRQRFDLEYLIVDGANKQAVEEMRKRHDLPLQAADKTGKPDFIELMNTDFNLGKIRLKRGACAPLVEETAASSGTRRVRSGRSIRPARTMRRTPHSTDGDTATTT